MKIYKEHHRVAHFLEQLRALPNLDIDEFKKRHGFSPFTIAERSLDINGLPGRLGFRRRHRGWKKAGRSHV